MDDVTRTAFALMAVLTYLFLIVMLFISGAWPIALIFIAVTLAFGGCLALAIHIEGSDK